jgi:hypothetical protein
LLPLTIGADVPHTRRHVCCLLVCIFYFCCLTLLGQQQTQVTTVQARPTVTNTQTTLDIYNADLSPGGFMSLRLCSSNGEILHDLTEKVDASKHGLQSVDVDLSRWATGVFFLVYVSRYEVATVKIVRIR